MFRKQLALRFILRPFLLDLLDSYDLCDSFREGGREGGGCHEVFVRSLRVLSYEADCGGGGGVERVREGYLGGLETLLIDDVLFRCEDEPDWGGGRVFVFFRVSFLPKKTLFAGGFGLFFLRGLDMF